MIQASHQKNRLRSFIPRVEKLEGRLALDATAWSSFAGNAQHTSISSVPAQPLEAVHWSTKVDNFPTSRAAHYGGPLITLNNTVIYPYKTGNTQATNTPDYHIVGRNGVDGALIWDVTTPYVPASYSWYPLNQPVLATATNRVYFAGKGGTIFYRDNPDSASGTVTQLAFFGSMAHYQANQAAYDNNVFIETPLTADKAGNIYFGFRVTGTNPMGLVSGIARIAANGTVSQAAGIWVSAFQAAGGADNQIGSVQQNAAPALSNDESTLYIVVKESGDWVYHGRLVGLNTSTLATQYNSGVLKDPRGADAAILNISTSSPMVAPDGRVFLGVFGNPYNGSRGWMLQFSGDLQTKYTPGGFGWDTTPSIVPASLLGSQYTGTSPYLIFTKYNNYYFNGGANDGGDGSNGIAILDPNATEVEYHRPEQNILVMKRVLYKLGPTPDWDYPNVPTAVREWCINYGAVDPSTNSVLVNSSDGKFYRWHLPSNTLIEPLVLTSGIGQPYTPTVVGVDGSIFGIQNGSLFALGQTPHMSIDDVAITEGTGGTTTATLTVSLNYPRTQSITVHWATLAGTAAQGADYTAGEGTLTFNPGVMTRTISVAIAPDALNESLEAFYIQLDSPSNAILLKNQAVITVGDDDPIPTFSISDASRSEGNTNSAPFTLFSFTVTLSAPSGRTVSVHAATLDQTASSAIGESRDYVAWGETLSFAPGETSKLLTIQVIGDTTLESNETFLIRLTASTHSTIVDDTGIGTIINDDNVPSLSIEDQSSTEGLTQTFTVLLSNPSELTITVAYATAIGSAEKGDFAFKSGTLTFEPGMLRRTISIRTFDDDLDELNEEFYVDLSQPVNAFLATGRGRGVLIDNDSQPSLRVREAIANEGNSGQTNWTFEVSLSNPSGRDVYVNYATEDSNAKVVDGDYQTASGTLHFEPGATTKSIQVMVLGDNIDEPNEAFFVRLSKADGATIQEGLVKGSILNDDALIFSIHDASIVEGDSGSKLVVFDVFLSTPSIQTVTVDYATADGTAKQNDGDYQSATGKLTFAPGEIQKSVSIVVAGDLRNESDESFFVNLFGSVGGAIGDGQGLGTILNDDAVPSLAVGDVTVPEMDYNTGTVNIYVQLSSPSGQNVTVDYRTENGTATSTSNIKDYIDTFGTLTFLPGQIVQSFQVSIVGDLRDEPNETVRVLLSSPKNATLSDDLAIINILDDDIALVTITGATVLEGNVGFAIAQVDVSISNPSDSRITIDYTSANGSATPGVDYITGSGTLIFEPGETTKTIPYQIIGDTLDEPNESFEVILSNGTGGVFLPSYSETDVNITDDDPGHARDHLFLLDQGDKTSLDILSNDPHNGSLWDPDSIEFRDGPNHGTLAMSTDGQVEWIPAPGFFGIDNFSYRVRDREGLFSNWAAVSLEINARPIAQNDEAFLDSSGSALVDVLGNDSDPDGVMNTASIEMISPLDPAIGRIDVLEGKMIRFVAGPSFQASWIVQYRVKDARRATSNHADLLIGVYNQNPFHPLDVDQDFQVSPLDVLQTINSLNEQNSRRIAPGAGVAPFFDVNADGSISPLDVLMIINYLNTHADRKPSAGEGEIPLAEIKPDHEVYRADWQATDLFFADQEMWHGGPRRDSYQPRTIALKPKSPPKPLNFGLRLNRPFQNDV